MPRVSSKINTSTLMRSPDSPVSSPEIKADPRSGLHLFGRVSDRIRRTIPTRDLTTAEIVTYTVEDTFGHKYYVDQYSPKEYHEIGSYVELPVYVKTYKKRNGDVGYSFCIQQQNEIPSRGERF